MKDNGIYGHVGCIKVVLVLAQQDFLAGLDTLQGFLTGRVRSKKKQGRRNARGP